jgi:hypothetical protein
MVNLVKCVFAQGGQQLAGSAPMGRQQLWQSRNAGQNAGLGGPMGGPMAGAAHDAKASIEGVDLLPSGDRDGALGRGRGARAMEWSGEEWANGRGGFERPGKPQRS